MFIERKKAKTAEKKKKKKREGPGRPSGELCRK